MKPENIKRFATLIETIKETELPEAQKSSIIGEINKILQCEVNTGRKRKFSLYNFTSGKKAIRKAFEGVYHDGGLKVATDGHVLCAIKSEYPAEFEGQILDQSGNFIEDCKFPVWHNVIPQDLPNDFGIKLSVSDIEEALKKHKLDKKIYKKPSELVIIRYGSQSNECLGFTYNSLKLMADAMNYGGFDTFTVRDEACAIRYVTDDMTFLFMPSFTFRANDCSDINEVMAEKIEKPLHHL